MLKPHEESWGSWYLERAMEREMRDERWEMRYHCDIMNKVKQDDINDILQQFLHRLIGSWGKFYVSQSVGSVHGSCSWKRYRLVQWVQSISSSGFAADASGWHPRIRWVLLVHGYRLSTHKAQFSLFEYFPCFWISTLFNLVSIPTERWWKMIHWGFQVFLPLVCLVCFRCVPALESVLWFCQWALQLSVVGGRRPSCSPSTKSWCSNRRCRFHRFQVKHVKLE